MEFERNVYFNISRTACSSQITFCPVPNFYLENLRQLKVSNLKFLSMQSFIASIPPHNKWSWLKMSWLKTSDLLWKCLLVCKAVKWSRQWCNLLFFSSKNIIRQVSISHHEWKLRSQKGGTRGWGHKNSSINHIQGGPQKCIYFSLAITFTKIRKASRFFHDSTAATRTIKLFTTRLSISCAICLIYFLMMSSFVCGLFSQTLSFRYSLRKESGGLK